MNVGVERVDITLYICWYVTLVHVSQLMHKSRNWQKEETSNVYNSYSSSLAKWATATGAIAMGSQGTGHDMPLSPFRDLPFLSWPCDELTVFWWHRWSWTHTCYTMQIHSRDRAKDKPGPTLLPVWLVVLWPCIVRSDGAKTKTTKVC